MIVIVPWKILLLIGVLWWWARRVVRKMPSGVARSLLDLLGWMLAAFIVGIGVFQLIVLMFSSLR